MKTRVISGAVLVVIAAIVLYAGGYVTGITTLLLSLGGMLELLRVYDLHKKLPGYIAYISAVVYYAFIAFDMTEYIMPIIIAFVLLELACYVISFPKYKDADIEATILAFIYVTVMLSYVYQIRLMKQGLALVIMIFICSWINDTCAYFVGVLFGKHKMSPKLSPKKSIEGLIGGIAGAAIVSAVYSYFIDRYVFSLGASPLIFAIIGAAGAIVAVIGDLTASAIKRDNEIKDYGRLIPGHGGIMDRFDSIIFTAPIIYYCALYMLG